MKIVKILHNVEPGIDHWLIAIVKDNEKYFIATRLAHIVEDSRGRVEAYIFDDWNIIAGPFKSIEEALEWWDKNKWGYI